MVVEAVRVLDEIDGAHTGIETELPPQESITPLRVLDVVSERGNDLHGARLQVEKIRAAFDRYGCAQDPSTSRELADQLEGAAQDNESLSPLLEELADRLRTGE